MMVTEQCWYCEVYTASEHFGLCKKCYGVGVLSDKTMQRLAYLEAVIEAHAKTLVSPPSEV